MAGSFWFPIVTHMRYIYIYIVGGSVLVFCAVPLPCEMPFLTPEKRSVASHPHPKTGFFLPDKCIQGLQAEAS